MQTYIFLRFIFYSKYVIYIIFCEYLVIVCLNFFWLPSIVSDIGVFNGVITLVVVVLLVLISCIILLVLVILVVIIIM